MDAKSSYKLSYSKGAKTFDEAYSDLKTVPEYLFAYYKDKPDKEAIVFVNSDGTRDSVTFRIWYERALHLAKCFIKLGVKKSECVAVSMRSCPEWLYAVFGAALAGARLISLSFTYADGSDVVAMMRKLKTCSLMVLDPGIKEVPWDIFRTLVDDYDAHGNVRSKIMPALRYLVCHEAPKNANVLSINSMLSWETPEVTMPTIYPEDIFILFQTSGSTGAPKPVAHTHASFIFVAKNVSKALGMKKTDGILYNDRPFPWIGGFPLAWIYGYTRVLHAGYCDPPEDATGFLIHTIRQERCTNIFILPAPLHSLISRQDELGDDWPIEYLLTGGQPITKPFAGSIGKVCQTFICGYGRTECTPLSLVAIQKPEDFPEYTIGYPIEGVEMKIVDEKEETVPVGKSGEIYIRAEGLFKEYYNDPEKTRAVKTDDGWNRTDDIGLMTEDGLFYFQGRKSELIICGGMNVAPSILEAAIQTCQGVARAICVPVPHDILYQVVCACVILEDGSDVTEAEIRSFCKEIHNDKRGIFTVLPEYYLFMKEFPETYSGKVARKELTRMANEILSTQLNEQANQNNSNML